MSQTLRPRASCWQTSQAFSTAAVLKDRVGWTVLLKQPQTCSYRAPLGEGK